MFNPVNLLLTLVGAGASARPGPPAPRLSPSPRLSGAGIPGDGQIAGVVWAATSDVGEPVPGLLPGARFGKVIAQRPGPSCGKRPNPSQPLRADAAATAAQGTGGGCARRAGAG